MRYVVFSDIHGNAYAMKQMLFDLQSERIDGYIYCGDIAGYYYDQVEAVGLIKSLKNIIAVKGNHDTYYQNAYKDEIKKEYYVNLYGNSYNTIESEVLEYINELPKEVITNINGLKIGVFHGSPEDNINGRIYPDFNKYSKTFEKFDICFLGHTHYQLCKIVKNTRIINPGSLGQPRDGKGFSYCIFDFETLFCDFRTVTINKEELELKIKLLELNEKNRNYLLNVLVRGDNND